MGLYDAYKQLKGALNWHTLLNSFMDAVGSDMTGKAPATHTHGAGGEVAAIGGTSGRPAVAAGFIYSNTDRAKLEILSANGSLLRDVEVVFASAAEILTGTEAGKAIAPDQFLSSNVRALLTAQGDLVYASAANTLARLAKGAANTKLFINAGATAPEWAIDNKIISFSRTGNAESGDVAYTGVGFKPSRLIVLVAPNDGGTLDFTVGFADVNLSGGCLINRYSGGAPYTNGSYFVMFGQSTGYQSAIVKSYDADGFTLTWTKGGSGSPGNGSCQLLAIR